MDPDLLKKFNVCDEVTPVNVEDGADTALVDAFEEADVTAIGNPSFRDDEESGRNHDHVDLNHCLVLQVFVVLCAFVRSAK